MIPIHLSNILESQDHNFSRAVYYVQIGELEMASKHLEAATAVRGTAEHAFLKNHIDQWLSRIETDESISLIWQISPDVWEGDWLRMLLVDSYDEVIIDFNHKISSRVMIVVDNLLDKKKENYYRSAFEAGCRICLIHLSDEAFQDDLSIYQWCNIVYRNYWSPLLAGLSNVYFFPLGYKLGFTGDDALHPANERPYLWSFAGNPNKTTRQMMLEGMAAHSEGELHFTSGFHASDNLAVRDYQSLISQSVIIPCPTGNMNMDSYRVYEALEAGAIPIVENKPGFDYFHFLLGINPIPKLTHWNEAPRLIESIIDLDGGVKLQKVCHDWWIEHKSMVRRTLGKNIRCKVQSIL